MQLITHANTNNQPTDKADAALLMTNRDRPMKRSTRQPSRGALLALVALISTACPTSGSAQTATASADAVTQPFARL